ncbi:MAG: DUF6719 family protein [Pseudomonadota bacterium]
MTYRTALLAGACLAIAACAPTILTEDPKPGEIPHNETVLVDDGSCPPGQVKELTGGNQNLDIPRKERCVPRP